MAAQGHNVALAESGAQQGRDLAMAQFVRVDAMSDAGHDAALGDELRDTRWGHLAGPR